MNPSQTFRQLPPEIFLHAVSGAMGQHAAQVDSVQELCIWWNEGPGSEQHLACAGSLVIWVSVDDGKYFEPANRNLGPAERSNLFSQTTWRTSVAACGKNIIVVFLQGADCNVLDEQGFLNTYLVNGTLFESIGIDSYDYKPGAVEAMKCFPVRHAATYDALLANETA